MMAREVVILALLGGLLSADDRAGWGGMLAHPIYSALLVGLLVGQPVPALMVGTALELVWLSALPMRGARRPDVVSGAVVGAATTALLLRETGDARTLLMVATGTAVGLAVGEAGGVVVRTTSRWRDARLSAFDPPADLDSRGLAWRIEGYFFFSLTFHAAVGAVLVAAALPVALATAERLTGVVGEPLVAGAREWLLLLPALGAAALWQTFAHRHLNRFLVLSTMLMLILLWIG
ncbi:MAG: PTS sugar transporter subunit IIC [Candidatus Krumholzibacteria bacterium]|nr:PTS sugar transporter subunit IIC [Candidatus Krumholzibacteria bacterium]